MSAASQLARSRAKRKRRQTARQAHYAAEKAAHAAAAATTPTKAAKSPSKAAGAADADAGGDDFERHFDAETGHYFYFSPSKNETRWAYEHEAAMGAALQAINGTGTGAEENGDEDDDAALKSDLDLVKDGLAAAGASARSLLSGLGASAHELVDSWERHFDEATGLHFFFNT